MTKVIDDPKPVLLFERFMPGNYKVVIYKERMCPDGCHVKCVVTVIDMGEVSSFNVICEKELLEACIEDTVVNGVPAFRLHLAAVQKEELLQEGKHVN